jgi:hypothetical protein
MSKAKTAVKEKKTKPTTQKSKYILTFRGKEAKAKERQGCTKESHFCFLLFPKG